MELYIATFAALFSVVNPLGAMPFFLAVMQSGTQSERNATALKACLFMAGILIVFFFGGNYILNFFGITINVLRIAGGLVIIKSGYDLLGGRHEKGRSIDKKVQEEALTKDDISFSPLAMPMLSGPGSIALLIGLSAQFPDWKSQGFIVAAIITTAAITYGILRVSPAAVRFMGQAGINAFSRMMGFMVLAIGIQFIANGAGPILETILTGKP